MLSAEIPATAATVAGGSREAVDKNLFFERTLPSVIAAMDAERTRVKTAIQQKLDLDENRYPLASAFADIAEYQLAGTLERGTQHVATVTAADTAKAKAELERTIQGCEIIEDLAADNRRLTMALYDGQNYRTKRLNIAAGSVDVPLEASDEDTYDALIAYLDDQDCRAADRKGAVDRILAAIEKSESDAAPSEAHE